MVQTLSEAASSIGVFSNSKAAAYWGYHITRSSFSRAAGHRRCAPLQCSNKREKGIMIRQDTK